MKIILIVLMACSFGVAWGDIEDKSDEFCEVMNYEWCNYVIYHEKINLHTGYTDFKLYDDMFYFAVLNPEYDFFTYYLFSPNGELLNVESFNSNDYDNSYYSYPRFSFQASEVGQYQLNFIFDDFSNLIMYVDVGHPIYCNDNDYTFYDNIIEGNSSNEMLAGTNNTDLIFPSSGYNIISNVNSDDCVVTSGGYNVIYHSSMPMLFKDIRSHGSINVCVGLDNLIEEC